MLPSQMGIVAPIAGVHMVMESLRPKIAVIAVVWKGFTPYSNGGFATDSLIFPSTDIDLNLQESK